MNRIRPNALSTVLGALALVLLAAAIVALLIDSPRGAQEFLIVLIGGLRTIALGAGIFALSCLAIGCIRWLTLRGARTIRPADSEQP